MRKSQVEQRRENENMMEAEKGGEHRRAVFFHYTISISVANVEIWSPGASGAGWVRRVPGNALAPFRGDFFR